MKNVDAGLFDLGGLVRNRRKIIPDGLEPRIDYGDAKLVHILSATLDPMSEVSTDLERLQ